MSNSISLFSSLAVAFYSSSIRAINTSAIFVTNPQITLRVSVTLLSRPAVPFYCTFVRVSNTVSVLIAKS